MAEQAYAYVTLIPVAKGFQGAIAKEMGSAGGAGGAALATSTGKGFAGNIKKAIGPAIGIAAGALAAAKIGGFLSGAVSEATDLNTALTEVVTLTGATGDAAKASLGEFASLVRDVSTEFGIAQSTVTDGLYNAISAGIPKGNVLEFMQVASQAAIAGTTDVNTAVDGLSTIVNAFGLEAGDAQAVADSMFTAVKGGKTTFEEMSSSMSNVAPAAAAAGVGFEEINAAIATLTVGGTDTSVATNQLKAALTGLQRPSEEMDGIFQALGHDSAQAAIESEGLGFALGAVSDYADGNNGKMQELLGSMEAVSAVQVIAGTGAEKFAAEIDAQGEAAGSTAAAFEEIDATRSAEINKVAFDNLALTLGTILLPIAVGFTDFLTTTFVPFLEDKLVPAFEGVTEFIIETLVPAFSAIFGFIRDNVPVIATFVGVLGTLLIAFNLQAIATKLLMIAQLKLNASLLLNPMALVALAIAALVAGIVYLATQTTFFQDIWAAMTAFVSQAWEDFSAVFMAVMEAIGDFFVTIGENLSESWEKTTDFLGEVWDGFVGIITGIWDSFTEVFDTAVNGFQSVFETVFEAIGGFFGGIVNGYINIFETFINFVIGGVNGLINTLNKLQINIPGFGDFEGFTIGFNFANLSTLSIPRVALAEGGYVDRPTNALIGEAGPEVVMPLDRFESMMGLGQGSGKSVNYYAAPNQSIDSEQELFQAMRRAKVVAGW